MKYAFDEIIDRRNTHSLKWNVNAQVLPMWVADMDFKTAPCIQEALQKIANFGIYGYTAIPETYYLRYQEWWQTRHHFFMDTAWMMYCNGVVPAISSIIRKLTSPAEKVLIQSPVYNIFYNAILNNGREVISSDLLYKDGTYTIDFVDLEQKLRDPQTTMMIVCNPHNPIGKIWCKEDLARIGELCAKHHVVVISDEIHCDITLPGKAYTPFASINEECAQNSITCVSASKTFNLAGLQSACIIVKNETLRHKVWRGIQTDEIGEPNIFACEAHITAFQKGGDWLEELCAYIAENKSIAQTFLAQYVPQIHMVASQATYLLWLDCCALHPFVPAFCAYLESTKQLLISSGSAYGKNGENFIRVNIACPQERMLEGLKRLKEGVEAFSEKYAI